MSQKVKFGLIIGVVALILTVFASIICGLFGPFLAVLGGALAAFLAIRQTATSKQEAAQDGAIAGLVVGAMMTVGQLIAAAINIIITRNTNTQPIIGTLPGPDQQYLYWIMGPAVGLCFGIADVIAAMLGGAGAGYLTAPKQSDTPAGQWVVEQPPAAAPTEPPTESSGSPGTDEW